MAVTQSPKNLGALLKVGDRAWWPHACMHASSGAHPPSLPMQVLQARGGQMVTPADRAGLHPLLIPLAADADNVTCLLRWPRPSAYKVG
jgi:hypothetical protein